MKVTGEVVAKVVRSLGGKSKPSKTAAREKARAEMPKRTVANIVEVAEKVLEKPKASRAELRDVLTQIRDRLKRLSKGNAS